MWATTFHSHTEQPARLQSCIFWYLHFLDSKLEEKRFSQNSIHLLKTQFSKRWHRRQIVFINKPSVNHCCHFLNQNIGQDNYSPQLNIPNQTRETALPMKIA
jgi:hypothetical protein